MQLHAPEVGSPALILGVRSSAWRAILTGGLIAGVLDIIYAFIAWGTLGASPVQICQGVASGLIGREAAIAGGLATAALGLFLHFTFALIMAAVYYAAALRIPVLVRRPVLMGSVYGVAIYIVMNFVVMPLSAIGKFGGSGPLYIPITSILGHMFLVGLPIALATRRALR